jgi:hypothetical protein
VHHARVAGLWVHRGPHSGPWPELTGARPSGHSRARRLVAEALEARGRRGDPSSWLTLGREAPRWASSGGEQNSVVVLGVRGARGEESWGAWCGEVEAGPTLYRLEGGWGDGRQGGERLAEVRFKGGELRGRLPGRGRGGGTD